MIISSLSKWIVAIVAKLPSKGQRRLHVCANRPSLSLCLGRALYIILSDGVHFVRWSCHCTTLQCLEAVVMECSLGYYYCLFQPHIDSYCHTTIITIAQCVSCIQRLLSPFYINNGLAWTGQVYIFGKRGGGLHFVLEHCSLNVIFLLFVLY